MGRLEGKNIIVTGAAGYVVTRVIQIASRNFTFSSLSRSCRDLLAGCLFRPLALSCAVFPFDLHARPSVPVCW